MVHRTWLSVAPSSAMMFGIAVLTIVVSISTTDCPTHNTTSASHGLVDFVPGVVMASPRVDRHRAGRPTGGGGDGQDGRWNGSASCSAMWSSAACRLSTRSETTQPSGTARKARQSVYSPSALTSTWYPVSAIPGGLVIEKPFPFLVGAHGRPR